MTLPRRTRLALLLSATLLLAACESLTASGGTDLPPEVDPALVACKAFAPIYWSAEDSDETILAVKQYNAAWLAICPAPEATP
ncbi:MAG: hypothetical protein WAT70_03720 [Rhizobiaceae bacterium]